ncbi:MAG: hypothetical protein RSD27_02210 [Ruthenibacterium sp.]
MSNDTQPIRIGWLSLVMTVVVLCMAVLSVLSFATARADFTLAQRYADTRTAMYAQECVGQALLAQANTLRAQGLSAQNICEKLGGTAHTETADIIVLTLDDAQGNRLLIRLAESGDALRIVTWRHSAVWQQAAGEPLWGTINT